MHERKITLTIFIIINKINFKGKHLNIQERNVRVLINMKNQNPLLSKNSQSIPHRSQVWKEEEKNQIALKGLIRQAYTTPCNIES